VDSVATCVRKGGFGVVAAGEEVVTIRVKGLATRAKLVAGIDRDEGEAHISFQE
jgi:hypothetical protein